MIKADDGDGHTDTVTVEILAGARSNANTCGGITNAAIRGGVRKLFFKTFKKSFIKNKNKTMK